MTRKIQTALQLGALAAAAMAVTSAQALDLNGYFRAGPQTQSANGHARNCYDLNQAGLINAGHYRLGNECNTGGEFMLSQGYKLNNVDAKLNFMVDSWSAGATPNTTGGVGIAIMSGEFKGIDVMPDATFFAGKVRERRSDVHILDHFFTDMSGVGAGFKGQSIGAGELGFGFYRGDTGGNTGLSRFNIEVQKIALGANNSLGVVVTAVSGKDANQANGNALSVKWDAKVAGLDNTVWAQTSKGTAGLNSNFNAGAGSDDAKWRLVETINGQAGKLGGQAVAVVGSSKDAGVKTDVMSLGGRLSYGVTQNFKVVGEAGYMSAKANGTTSKLTKFTIAPTLSTGPDFWTRPELRLYVTTAKWNNAANAAAGATGLTGNGDNKTTGTSYGAQVEWWF